jgi:hypothetical protein
MILLPRFAAQIDGFFGPRKPGRHRGKPPHQDIDPAQSLSAVKTGFFTLSTAFSTEFSTVCPGFPQLFP